jgi:hypothetical protein
MKSGQADVATHELERLAGRGTHCRVVGVDALVVLVDPLDTAGSRGCSTGDHPQAAAPTERDVREGIEGNLCRCTGYHNIVKAVQHAAKAGAGKEVTA